MFDASFANDMFLSLYCHFEDDPTGEEFAERARWDGPLSCMCWECALTARTHGLNVR